MYEIHDKSIILLQTFAELFAKTVVVQTFFKPVTNCLLLYEQYNFEKNFRDTRP